MDFAAQTVFLRSEVLWTLDFQVLGLAKLPVSHLATALRNKKQGPQLGPRH